MSLNGTHNLPDPALRILQLNSLLTGGGTDDQCIKLASGLRTLEQHVWMAGPSGRPLIPEIQERAIPLLDTGGGGAALQLVVRATRFIRRQGIQIIHAHHGRDLWPAILAGRLSGRRPKIVLTRHLAKSPASWLSRHFLLGQCDALIAVSNFVARVLCQGVYEPDSPEPERRSRPPLRGDHAKIHVIYGGIDTGRFRPADALERRRQLGLEPEHFGLAVVGGYDLPRGKGQREFLAAAARVHKTIPHARFIIIGRGNMAEILKRDIGKLELTGKAWLAGYASDMPQVMNAIDCLVHCQVGTEALGLVVCEAHACGKPVIASALDGVPEAFGIGNLGQLVQPENIDQLAQAMAAQAAQARLTPSQAQALHARVEQVFSMERSAAEVLRLYRQLLLTSCGPSA
jgi:glycosyltransferase involved in cell wall biosynthesis